MKHHIDRIADKVVETVTASGDPDEALSTREAARLLNISEEWLEIGRHKGYGPKFTRLSARCIRYTRRDIIKWLESRTHQSTAEYA